MLFNLAFILLCVLCISWFCGLMSDINLEEFSVIISSNISSLFTFSIPITCMLMPFVVDPQFLDILFLFFFSSVSFLFAFHFGSFYWHILKLRDAFLSHVQSTNESIKGILISVMVLLVSSISSWFFLRISIYFHIFAYIMHLLLHVVYFFH